MAVSKSEGAMIELKIDNQIVEVENGETVLQVAQRTGIDIPSLCYHPCMSIAGNCRICLVQVNGRPKLMPACNLEVIPGMEIDTQTPPVVEARKAVMQFISLNHPGDCGICDKAGECRLQEYHMKYGDYRPLSIEGKNHFPKFYNLSERIMLDNERCILCSRCVRFTREISKSNQLGIVERGSHSLVQRLDCATFDDPYSDNVIGNCPVGALLSKDFLYKSRVWYLETVPSVCTGCARGCSVNVWRKNRHWQFRSSERADKNQVAYRITPLDNPEINGPWLCNKGFDLHKSQSRPRVLAAKIAGRDATIDEAIEAASRMLAGASKPAVLLSAHASNEELEAFKSALAERVAVYTRQDNRPESGEVVEDDFLIRADKNPNSYSLTALFGDRPFDAGKGHDLVILWGDNLDYTSLGGAQVIHLSSFAEPTAQPASVLIPISTLFERSGSFCNFEGKRNNFEKVFDKPTLVQHAGDLFGRL